VANNLKASEPALASGRKSENWGSRVGVILAVAGSAVGLGNFLRFPGNVAINGGGVFMIPYFISLLLLGIPICWMEWTMGRYGGRKGFNSAPGIFSVLWNNPLSKYFGALALIVPVGIYMYYVYVEAWCLAYAWDYVSGSMAGYSTGVAGYKNHFDDFVGTGYNGFLLRGGGGLQESVLFLIIVFAINFFLIYRGLTKGIEAFCKYAMPALILFAIIVLVRVLTLNTPDPNRPEANVTNALGFMWSPSVAVRFNWNQAAGPEIDSFAGGGDKASLEVPKDLPTPTDLVFQGSVKGGLKSHTAEFRVRVTDSNGPAFDDNAIAARPGEKITLALDPALARDVSNQSMWAGLADPQLWLAAAGQIFFTLSVGFGIILNYASYLRRDDDVVLSGLTASSTNEFCEVCLGGLITIPAAFLFLSAADLTPEVLQSSFKLGFVALPSVFARMPAGDFFGAIWFFMLFMAAITSSLSMLQPAIAFLEEGFGMGRRFSVTCLGMLTAIGSLLVVYFSKDLIALSVMDFWIGTVCIFLLAMIQSIVVGWLFGIEKVKTESTRGAAMRVPRLTWFVMKYVTPTYLLVIFVFWCLNSIPAEIHSIQSMKSEDRGTVLLMLAFVAILLLFFGLLVNLAAKRWRAMGKLPVADDDPPVRLGAKQ